MSARRPPTSSPSARPGSRRGSGSCSAPGSARSPTSSPTRSTIPYADLPGFRVGTVAGHAGALALGRLDGVPVACLRGRSHVYEGIEASAVTTPIRTLRRLGAEILVLTNAAGSLRPEAGPGSLVALTDHINLQGFNPLMGPNDEDVGPRFPSLLGRLRPRAARRAAPRRRRARHAAARRRLPRRQPARASRPRRRSAPSARSAPTSSGCRPCPRRSSPRHCGLRVAAVSVVTNLAEGMGERRALARADAGRGRARGRVARPAACDDGWRARLRHPRDARRCASP